MIWDKTLFHNMYNNVLFIDDFIKDQIWCSAYTARFNGFEIGSHLTMDLETFIKESKVKKDIIEKEDGVIFNSKQELIDLYIPKDKKDGEIYEIEYEVAKKDGGIDYWKSTLRFSHKDNILNKLHVKSGIITEEKLREQELIKAKEDAEAAAAKQLIAEDIALCGSWEYILDGKKLILSKNSLKRLRIDTDLPSVTMTLEEYVENSRDRYMVLRDGKFLNHDHMKRLNEPLVTIIGVDKEALDDINLLKDSYSSEFLNVTDNSIIVNTAIPIVENGKLVKFIGTTRDVTVERGREGELIEARMKAEEAADQQSRFVANLSHEIRTPLNAILGYAEIMKRQNIDKKLNLYLKSIDTAGNSLLSLVNDILDYSKVKANKFTANYIPESIGDFCEELKILFYHKIAQKNLEFNIIYDSKLPVFMLPVATMRQVLINILGNASKFTNEGEIELKVIAKENEDKTYNINISVTDTGIGIPENKLESIFKEFEQADISHEKQGTGLGLALSLNFAKLLGAEVSVTSKVGEGSTFTLEMKKIEVADSELQIINHINGNKKIKFYGQKVLILDDVANNREVLSTHCKFMNLEVKSFESGAGALREICDFNPEVILTDLRMPEMNGEDFSSNIRKLKGFENIPIICITASVTPEENYHIDNFDEILNKPLNSSKLSAAISKYIEFEIVEDMNVSGKKFNIQESFDNLTMSDDEFDKFMERGYEEIKQLRVGFNPKKVGVGAVLLEQFASDINNEGLREISVNLIEYCDALDISNIMECIRLANEFIENR